MEPALFIQVVSFLLLAWFLWRSINRLPPLLPVACGKNLLDTGEELIRATAQPPNHLLRSQSQNLDLANHLPQQEDIYFDPSLNNLAQKAANTLAARAACVYVLGHQGDWLYPRGCWHASEFAAEFSPERMGEGLVGVAARSSDGQVVRPNTLESPLTLNGNDALAIPLYAGSMPLGAILVLGKAETDAFDSADEQRLIEVATAPDHQLSVQNVWLKDQQDQWKNVQDVIIQLSRAIADPSIFKDDQSIIRVLQPYVTKLFRFEAVEFFRWNEENQTLERTAQLLEEGVNAVRDNLYSLGEGYTGWIADRQVPLLITDTNSCLDPAPKNGIGNFPFGSYLGVPVKAGSQLLGTLELMARAPQSYGQSDVTLLEIVGSQVAVALENVRLVHLTNKQLQQRVDELAGLQRVSNELNSTLDLNKILSLVLEEAMQLTHAGFGGVYFYNSQADQFFAYYAEEGGNLHALTVGSGLVNQVFQSGQSLLVSDISLAQDFADTRKGVQSRVAVPVYHGGESIGVIALDSSQKNFFNQNQLRYLEALANHAAVAIGNAQAYQQQILEREQASRRAEQLARLSEISNAFRTNRPLNDVLEDIVFAVAESVGYDVVLISLISGLPPKIHPQVGAGIPILQMEQLKAPTQAALLSDLQAVLLEEFRLGQSYFIPAEHMSVWQGRLRIPYFEKDQPAPSAQSQMQWTSIFGLVGEKRRWQTGDLLLVPLTDTSKRIIGLLTVTNPVDGQRPDEAALKTLETFANHAAAAIENAQLFELEQQRRRLADTLRGVAEAISSQLEFDELLNIILQELSLVIDYDSATVHLLRQDKLVVMGGRGWKDPEEIAGLSISMSDEHPGRAVIESQEPLVIQDVRQRYADAFSEPIYQQVRSWLGVPLTYGTNVLGVMVLVKSQPDFFNQNDMETIAAFANQVAVALQNAQLFEEARQQVRQLAALTEVAQSINRALDLNEVLDLVLDAVFDLVGQTQGSIWLIDDYTNTVKMARTKNIPEFLVDLFNESNVPVNSEPFTSVIQSRDVVIVQGDTPRDTIANFGLPFPDDVTYVPLKIEETVIGILAIEAVIQNKNMLQLVNTLADLAAVAIDSARLLEDTRRRASEMQHLYNLGVEVSGMLAVRQVLRSVIANALTLIGGHLGAIVFYDEQIGQQVVEISAATAQLKSKFGLGTLNFAEANKKRKEIGALWVGLADKVQETRNPLVVTLPTLDAEKATNRDTLVGLPLRSVIATARKLDLKAILGVPMFLQDRVMGAILVSTLDVHHFDERDIQSLSFVANQAAVAIRNAQLVQRLNQLTEELEQRVAQRTEELARTLQDLTEERDRVGTLYQIARELSSSFDLDRVLNEALNLVNRAIGISQGAILLLDRESEYLIYKAALGRNVPLPRGGMRTPYKIGYGLAGRVVENREPRLVSDLNKDPFWVDPENVEQEDAYERRSAIAVPLSTGDDVLGVLLLFHPEPDYFSDDHLKLVTAASAQIATAVNNAELYRLITDQANRLGVLYRQQASEAAKNQAILEGITDGVLVLDATRSVVLVNPKAAEILNIKPDDVEQAPLQQILGRSGSPVELELTQLLYENLLQALTQLEAGQQSVQFRIEAGPKVVMVSVAPVSLGSDEHPSIVAVLRDISKEAEIERLKNEFISTVSHELRTPMTLIKGYTDLLLSGNEQIGQLNLTQDKFVRVMQSNANRLTDLVNDILEISRIETGRIKLKFAALDIRDVILDVATSFEREMRNKELRLATNLPDHLPKVYADKSRLTQILVNLIGNAWQYTPEGGEIEISAQQTGRFVQVNVTDTGIGIPEKDIPYLFDRFFRSERTEVQIVDGTGLGLSITKSFVEMLGGQIWVSSELDAGTTFSFSVPLKGIDSKVSAEQAVLTEPTRLLIVTSDTKGLDFIRLALEETGLQVVVEQDIETALLQIRDVIHTLKAVVVDAKQAELPQFFRQLSAKIPTSQIPILLASFIAGDANNEIKLQVVASISPAAEDQVIMKTIEHVLTGPDDLLKTRMPGTSARMGRILIAEANQNIAGWLRETLVVGGYEVQRAFNSRQAIDMVAGNRPDLILLSTAMSAGPESSILAQLRQEEDLSHIPVVLIMDRLETANSTAPVIWGSKHWSRDHTSLSAQELIDELDQFASDLEEES